jgi:hypothetical protein
MANSQPISYLSPLSTRKQCLIAKIRSQRLTESSKQVTNNCRLPIFIQWELTRFELGQSEREKAHSKQEAKSTQISLEVSSTPKSSTPTL